MATEITLPKLGMNTEHAIIVGWRKQEGEAVAVGDVIADVETEKATIELEAEVGGTLRRLLVSEGEDVSVHQAIAVIGTADEDISALVATLTAPAVQEESHVERTYQAWKQPVAASNGHHTAQATLPPRELRPTGGSGSSGLDAAAIRQRLQQRGVLQGEPTPAVAKTRLVIYGCGLGAKQLLEVTRQRDDIDVVGLVDDNLSLAGTTLGGCPVLGGFADLAALASRREIDGVVLSFHSEVRKRVHERIRDELGIRIYPLVDPRAIVGMDVTIEDGALVEAGAVIGPGTVVGEGTIVDVGAVIAHDCFLGPFSHLSPGCTLSGVVCLKGNVLVGVGSSLNSTINIGRNVIITPGAAVMNDIPDDVVIAGVPAKVIGASRRGA
jgi:sugar O-acyltransferase (sialic acid O-acetyltransferase NeuD family)